MDLTQKIGITFHLHPWKQIYPLKIDGLKMKFPLNIVHLKGDM